MALANLRSLERNSSHRAIQKGSITKGKAWCEIAESFNSSQELQFNIRESFTILQAKCKEEKIIMRGIVEHLNT